jgi:hypothetical protein
MMIQWECVWLPGRYEVRISRRKVSFLLCARTRILFGTRVLSTDCDALWLPHFYSFYHNVLLLLWIECRCDMFGQLILSFRYNRRQWDTTMEAKDRAEILLTLFHKDFTGFTSSACCLLHSTVFTYLLHGEGYSLKADSHSACQTTACFLYGTRRFITMLTKSRH